MVLYFWSGMFASGSWAVFSNIISVNSLIAASIAAIVATVFYLWTPKTHRPLCSLIVYLTLAATAGVVVVDSGGISSPFIVIWMLVAVFASVFGLYAVLPVVLAVVGYTLYLLSVDAARSGEIIMTALFSGILPLAVGFITWHRQSDHGADKEKAYRELANELSQVAGKSDVVINAIADGVLAINTTGEIELINPAAQHMIGWVRQDALGLDYKSVLKLINSTNKPVAEAEDPIAQALLTNKPAKSEKLSLVTEAEKKILVSITVSPIGTSQSGAIIVFRDISKDKLEERQQAEFISTASHEMRTPVASIEGYLGLVLNPAIVGIDDKARDYVTKAHEAAQHLGRLFQDLLDVSKAEDGRLQNDPKVVNVVEFVSDVVDGLRYKAEEKGLRLYYKPKPDVGAPQASSSRRQLSRATIGDRVITPVYYADVDNDHLREVVANLVENAIKYTLTGDVTVDVTGDDKHVQISVKDSGIGIPPEDMTHLFQKFYRVDNTATREIGGTGLGLYLCRRLAEAMSGRIWGESEYKQGSIFYLEVPRVDHEDAMRMIEQAALKEAIVPEDPVIIPEVAQPLPAPAQYVPQPQYPPTTPQLAVAQPQPPQPPSYQQPAPPVVAQPAYQPPQAAPPQAPRYATIANPQNTPLSAIEQNPSHYTIAPRNYMQPTAPPAAAQPPNPSPTNQP